jgi:hypothetical protein
MTDVVGWAATMAFVSSYFFGRPEALVPVWRRG